MRKFEILVCANASLEVVARFILQARNVDAARELGIIRYGQPGYFVGAQNI